MHKRTLVTAGLVSASLLSFGACGNGEDRTPPVSGATSSGDLSDDRSAPAKDRQPDASGGGSYTDRYNFTATTFDGETFELAVHKGTPVVINFWESW